LQKPVNRPLVVVMAKEPVPGQVKTRFIPEMTGEESAALYQCMIEDRIDEMSMLAETDLAVAFTPSDAREAFAAIAGRGFALFAQRGNDLGKRMENIFIDTCTAGYDVVTIIGSDSPDLPKAIVQDSGRILVAGTADVVFGPSYDGGYYLVGMRKPHPLLFENIPWSTDRVLRVTLARAGELGLKIHMLPWWNDLDTFADLVAFYDRHREKRGNKHLRGAKTLTLLADLKKRHRIVSAGE
jgi:rSAM/selenodomain-associated transferase 1